MLALEAWATVGALFVVFVYLYAEEFPQIFDWMSWNAATFVMNIRLSLWKAWLYPRLRIETFIRVRRARARQRAMMAKETNHQTNNSDD